MSAGTADGDSPDDDAANRGGSDRAHASPTVRDRTVGQDRRGRPRARRGRRRRPAARARADRGRRRGIRRLRPDRRGARGDDRGRADRERRHPAPPGDDVVVTVRARTTSATLPSPGPPTRRRGAARTGGRRRPGADRDRAPAGGDGGLRVHRPGEPRGTRVGADARDHARRRRLSRAHDRTRGTDPDRLYPGALGGRRPPLRGG